jgi:hypothetical protein
MITIKTILNKRLLGATVMAAALITPALASAQDVPAYAAGSDQQIQGTIDSINGTWNVTVSDANGYTDSVELHQGTVINPTGLTLEPGMNVTIDGYPDGSNFDAVEIDTPYQYQGPPPTAVYYGPGSWYPGYAYGWGPSFSLVFDFGSRNFEQRSFAYGGEVRRPMAPPAGWQDRQHGYIGHAYPSRPVSFAPQTRTFAAPQRSFAQPQQQRTFAAPQQQRSFAQPPQTRSFAPQQRTFAAPQQQQRTFAAPQQQRTFAAPPQARSFAAPQRSFARPSSPAPRGNGNGGEHR